MRVFYLFFLITFCPPMAMGQINLVPNPSFEDTLNCNGFQLFNSSFPWFNPTQSTPDYYYGLNPSCGFSSFNNLNGYQPPRTGIGYVGIFLYSGTGRDYIEIKLIDSLKQGHHYSLSFYVSRSNLSTLATDALGAYFSTTPILSTTFSLLLVSPQIENPNGNFLIDSANWMNISGIYTSIGNEQYLTIGNFMDSTNTHLLDVDNTQGTYNNSVYYLDDVSLIDLDSNVSIEETNINENAVSIYPNPSFHSEEIKIELSKLLHINEIILCNQLGNTLFKTNVKDNDSTYLLKLPKLSTGFYFLIIDFETRKRIVNKILVY